MSDSKDVWLILISNGKISRLLYDPESYRIFFDLDEKTAGAFVEAYTEMDRGQIYDKLRYERVRLRQALDDNHLQFG